MKAARRHELKENDLAHAFAVARHYMEENGKQFTIVIIVLVAVVAGVGLSVRARTAAVEDLWRRKAQLSYDDPKVGRESLAALASMRQGVSDERFVFTSLIEQGQQALRLAQRVPDPPDPELSSRARKAFEELLSRFKDNPLALGIAYSGLATVEENEFVIDHDPVHEERAREYLTAIIREASLNGLPFQRMASDRRDALDATFTELEFEYPQPEEPPEKTAVDDNADDSSLQDDGAPSDVEPPDTQASVAP